MTVAFRTVEDDVPLCAEHAWELLGTGFVTKDELRQVWDDEIIGQVAVRTGQRIQDLRQLHGRRLVEECIMCGVEPSLNKCDACGKALPPQWPSLYCSNQCALEDA